METNIQDFILQSELKSVLHFDGNLARDACLAPCLAPCLVFSWRLMEGRGDLLSLRHSTCYKAEQRPAAKFPLILIWTELHFHVFDGNLFECSVKSPAIALTAYFRHDVCHHPLHERVDNVLNPPSTLSTLLPTRYKKVKTIALQYISSSQKYPKHA